MLRPFAAVGPGRRLGAKKWGGGRRKRGVTLLKNIINAPRFGMLWADAQQLAAERRYAEAKAILERAYGLFGWRMPSGDATITANMTVAMIGIGLDDETLAVESVKAIYSTLNAPRTHMSRDDRAFVQTFCARVLESRGLQLTEVIPGAETPPAFELKAVKRMLRLNFNL